ncbi:MAG TPA: beta-ketoacyl-[acyl-carrier-protein] synthase family protein [Steroidobacteraceae bacterium]|nr:beta-ketoacyl-[acyl-carrier-protein] synthase family protein [Steroidobacteraceae bacterium]
MRASPLCVTAFTATCAAGAGRHALTEALRMRRTGLSPNDFSATPLHTWIGRVGGLEQAELPGSFADWECRNNRLAWLGITQDGFRERALAARERYGPERVAVVLGTSTSSIGATEEAYARLQPDGQYPADLQRMIVHSPHSLCHFVQHALELDGVATTIATACSSSAKVFAYAERLVRRGLADAALVGGTDTLCGSILFGFHSLGLLSPEPCRPFDPARRGLSLGEAAGFALLERDGDGPWLLGYGESSDAHHMSSPHPDGRGVRLAIQQALTQAGLRAEEIDYINLHGTASQKNDEIEGRVVAELFPERTFASSTKGWTGHTLGAAGILEAVITLLALETGLAPGTLNSSVVDKVCGAQVRLHNERRDLRHASSHSFGFGGSNCVLLFGREARR